MFTQKLEPWWTCVIEAGVIEQIEPLPEMSPKAGVVGMGRERYPVSLSHSHSILLSVLPID